MKETIEVWWFYQVDEGFSVVYVLIIFLWSFFVCKYSNLLLWLKRVNAGQCSSHVEVALTAARIRVDFANTMVYVNVASTAELVILFLSWLSSAPADILAMLVSFHSNLMQCRYDYNTL